MTDFSEVQPPVPLEFDLHELNQHFKISNGKVDVFLVHKRGKNQGRRYFIGQWNSGDLLIGLKEVPNVNNVQLIASCSSTAKLISLNWDEVTSPQQLQALNKWKEHLLRNLTSYSLQYPKELLIDENTKPEKA